ncbi:MAG: hypothetical protein ABF649_15805 [Bacillus sp. (in: firmicutes)]
MLALIVFNMIKKITKVVVENCRKIVQAIIFFICVTGSILFYAFFNEKTVNLKKIILKSKKKSDF